MISSEIVLLVIAMQLLALTQDPARRGFAIDTLTWIWLVKIQVLFNVYCMVLLVGIGVI